MAQEKPLQRAMMTSTSCTEQRTGVKLHETTGRQSGLVDIVYVVGREGRHRVQM